MIDAKYIAERRVLRLTADNESRSDLKDAYERGGYYYAEMAVSEGLHEAYEFVPPENVPGALTDAPILVDCDDLEYPDNGDRIIRDGARVFWFPNYMVEDPFESLKNRGYVEFREADPYPDEIERPSPLKREFIESHFPGGDRQGIAIWIGEWSFPADWDYDRVVEEYPQLARSETYEPDSWDTGCYWWDHKGNRHGPYNGGADGYMKAQQDGARFKDPEPDPHPDQLALAI